MDSENQRPKSAPPLTILLVDDDPLIRANGKELLEALGHRVATAAEANEALLASRSLGKVDLAILDYHLPCHNGLTVLQKLKALEPEVRVLMASGYFSSEDVAMIRESNASGLIYKPYRISALEALIHQVMKGEKAF
jgi:CheY-like chemotaxis protein